MTTQISSDNIQSSTLITLGSPTITNIQVTDSSYNVLNDTAVNTLGGYIKITGTKFYNGAQVYFGNTVATSISFVNSTTLNVQLPAATAGTYDLFVVNPSGKYALKKSGVTFSPINITWVTDSNLANQVTGVPISIQLSATGASGYQLQSGSTLPSGLTLSSSGLLSGTVTVASPTTYNFTIEAYDTELQDASRAFSLTVLLTNPPPSVQALIVAGGAGGGYWKGGGGGAGGLLYYGSETSKTPNGASISITAGVTYTITVGAGGASNTAGQGDNGANSSFVGTGASYIALGGGGGGAGTAVSSGWRGGNGGSGGGGGGNASVDNVSLPGGTGTSGQGSDGGAGQAVGNSPAGGGGGAGAVGGTATASSNGPPWHRWHRSSICHQW